MYVVETPAPTIVVNPVSSGAVIGTSSSSSAVAPRELKTVEFREGDAPEKFAVTVPADAVPGISLRVRLGGREFSVLLPDYIKPGEAIIVITPAPTTLPTPSAPPVQSVPVITASAAGSASGPGPGSAPRVVAPSGPREIKTQEYREDDIPARYPYTIPADAAAGELLPVVLSGRSFTIRLPDYVRPGESVTVVAPAAII